MAKTLVEITEEEFIEKINESLLALDEEHKYMYSLYIHYLQDKAKNDIACYLKDNQLCYKIKPKEPMGFKIPVKYKGDDLK